MRLNISNSALVLAMLLTTSGQALAEAHKHPNEELQSFVVANTVVNRLQQQAQQVMKELDQKAGLAITNSGLTTDQYNAIATDLKQDKDLQKRLEAVIKEMNANAQKKGG